MSRRSRQLFAGLLVGGLLAGGAWFFWRPLPVQADLSASPCPGNICQTELYAGGQSVLVSWTEHVDPDGQLKVRFEAGSYPATGQQISYIVYGAPKFNQASADHRPAAGTYLLPDQAVNAGRTSYERRSVTGCPSGCTVDMVVQLRYSGLAPGQYAFSVGILQLQDQASREGLTFYVDNAATQNSNESDSLDAVLQPATPPYYVCADRHNSEPIDNDLSLLANCQDPQCAGQPGDAADPANQYKRCEIPEQSCSGGFDNDGDGLTDCLDPDCDGRCGEWHGNGTCLAYCQYQNEGGPLGSIVVQDGSIPYGSDALSPCRDGFDNDGDSGGQDRTDCHDNREVLPGGVVQTYETWTQITAAKAAAPGGRLDLCWRHDEYGCPESEAGFCADGIDDDIDQSYALDQNYDAETLTGVSCTDYDCAGDPACPSRETEVVGGGTDNDQCFDGLDNDLDRYVDCADPDCTGVESSDGRICADKEFDLGQRIMHCNDFVGGQPFDNDGDGPPNCEDSDCWRKFGKCQWCPAIEDYRYDACADGEDNDTGEGVDCADPDCTNRLGLLDGAAYCRAGSETATGLAGEQCSDGLDNDSNGLVDCRDPACDGVTVALADGYPSYTCASGGETGLLCNDQGDNDGDEYPNDQGIDCLDVTCWGQGNCHAQDWQLAPAIEVPDFTGYQAIKQGGTVEANVMTKSRVNGEHTIGIRGSAEYPSFTVIVGTATDDNYAYPYASAPDCTLEAMENGSPVPPGQYSVKTVSEKAVMIFRKGTAVRPNLTLRCQLPSEPTLDQQFTVALSSLLSGGGAEFGEIVVSNRVYEGNAPTIKRIEVEGEDRLTGTLTVPYGAFRDFRIIPDEPFDGAPPADTFTDIQTSGISSCTLRLDCPGPDCDEWVSADGNCVVKPTQSGNTNRLTFNRRRAADVDEGPLLISALAEDGAANLGPESAPIGLEVNVTPVAEPLRIAVPGDYGTTLSPFVNRQLNRQIGLWARFTTAENVGFSTSDCQVELFRRDESGAGSLIATGSLPATVPPGGYTATCEGAVTDLDDLIESGQLRDQNFDHQGSGVGPADRVHYYVRVGTQDDKNNWAFTEKQEFFVCETIPGPGQNEEDNPCHWVDFDNDGATEGFYTYLYTSVPDWDQEQTAARACDNCVGQANPGQVDRNMDGIGDTCNQQGRCELDRERVCDDFSYGFTPENDNTCLNQEYEYGGGDSVNMCCTDPNDPLCCPMPSFVQSGLCRFGFGGPQVDDDADGVWDKCRTVLDCGDGDPDTYYCDRPVPPDDFGMCYDFTGDEPVAGDGDGDGVTDDCQTDAECLVAGPDFACTATFGTCVDLVAAGLPFDGNGDEVTDRCVTYRDCGDGDPARYACRQQQACRPDWGVCSVTGFVCFADSECFLPGQCHNSADGQLILNPTNPVDCRSDADCSSVLGGPPEDYVCDGGERCVGLVFPWLETQRGNVFSGLNIRSQEIPPANRYNATFCITAKGLISKQEGPAGEETVFRSQICPKTENERDFDQQSGLSLPEDETNYGTVLGRLDVSGLLAGRYGEVVGPADGFFPADVENLTGQPLKGRVYLVNGDLTIDAGMEFVDSLTSEVSGHGTIVVRGGNLTINQNLTYSSTNASAITSTEQVASLAWVVLEDPETKAGGNIFIDRNVTDLVGAYYAGGQSGFHTVAPPATDSPYPLTVRGLVMARQFHLSRAYRSEERGSEQFLYDGRALLNPPPGFQDISKSLPIYGLAPPLP